MPKTKDKEKSKLTHKINGDPSKTVENETKEFNNEDIYFNYLQSGDVFKDPEGNTFTVTDSNNLPDSADTMFWISYQEIVACFSYSVVRRMKLEDYTGLEDIIKTFSDYIKPVFLLISPMRYEIDSDIELCTKMSVGQLRSLLNPTGLIENCATFKDIGVVNLDCGLDTNNIPLAEICDEIIERFQRVSKL